MRQYCVLLQVLQVHPETLVLLGYQVVQVLWVVPDTLEALVPVGNKEKGILIEMHQEEDLV